MRSAQMAPTLKVCVMDLKIVARFILSKSWFAFLIAILN